MRWIKICPIDIASADHQSSSRSVSRRRPEPLASACSRNTSLAVMPGNTFLPASATGLPRDSVVTMTALVILNKSDLSGRVGTLPFTLLSEVDRGLRQVLGI